MRIANEFKKFALRGNVIDLAVGFTVGAAFSSIAQSLVGDVIMPPLGLAIGSVDFSNLFLVLQDGRLAEPPYATLDAARAAGAVTLNYGLFLTQVVTFLILAVAMFVLIRLISRLDESLDLPFMTRAVVEEKNLPAPPLQKKCPYCLSVIAYAATRCPACTSHLEHLEAATA